MAGHPWQKRAFDIVGALLGLVIVSPLLVVIALLLLVLQGPPLFYREARIGLFRCPFTIVKFRTMAVGANRTASVAPGNDPQLTPIGRWLKPSRLDELPQLFNVLKGDMSLVGPRPLPPAHLQHLPEATAARLLTVKPGITSRAALAFIAEDDVLAEVADAERTYLDVILPAKAAAHADHPHAWSLSADIKTLLSTLVLAWSPQVWRDSRRMVRSLLAARD